MPDDAFEYRFKINVTKSVGYKKPKFDGKRSVAIVPQAKLDAVLDALDDRTVKFNANAADVDVKLAEAAFDLLSGAKPAAFSGVSSFLANDSIPVGPVWKVVPPLKPGAKKLLNFFLHPSSNGKSICVGRALDGAWVVWTQLAIDAVEV